jgi:hypothetical protein
MLMMQATTSLFLSLPVMACLPGRFRFLTRAQYLTHGESPLATGITQDPKRLVADVLATHAGIAR